MKGAARRILRVNELLYCERRNHSTFVTLETDALETGLKLDEIEALLPEGAFARPHNSYLVNLAAVRATSRTDIRLANGSVIPVSNQKRAAFMQALAESI